MKIELGVQFASRKTGLPVKAATTELIDTEDAELKEIFGQCKTPHDVVKTYTQFWNLNPAHRYTVTILSVQVISEPDPIWLTLQPQQRITV